MIRSEHVLLSSLTTLRLGGAARHLVEVEHEEDLSEIEREASGQGRPLFVLGAGSNVVAGDGGFAGVVAHMALKGVSVRQEGSRVVVDAAAGEEWDGLVARAVDEGWSGLECLSGIPGLVGATPIQNVGAYGREIRQVLARVRVFDRARGLFRWMAAEECAFGYRTSLFKYDDRWVVTRVELVLDADPMGAPVRYPELARALSLSDGGRAPLREVRDAVIGLRRGKGMVLDAGDPDSVSAGSFFVNPVVGQEAVSDITARAGQTPPVFDDGEGRFKVPAAWLVERAGFPRGWGAGRVGVSRKHALALVNRGGATTSELLELARAIRNGVMAQFGVELRPEPVLVGCLWASDGL
jgi:UDP-N-acetylmuramate dehydrogenase